MSLLELKNIGMEYKNEDVTVHVLKDLNLKIDEGEFLGVMGSSGAGKSTLLYVMSGLERPTKGSVFFEENDIWSYSEDALADVRLNDFGFIFQFYNLVPVLNVEENIQLPLQLAHKDVGSYKEKLELLLEEVGLKEKRKCMPAQLSGGQQQRVAIARALIGDPKIIFADEPTGNLDSKASQQVMELLQKLCKRCNTTVVMVTHNQDLCEYTSRIIRIVDGEVDLC